jgi:AcrR family transcriptional regulator
LSADRQAPSRRNRILASAEAEFAAHGLAGARVERIAAGASVNKQLLFHYFGSKAGLYKAVSDSVSNRTDLDAPKGQTPAEQLRGLAARLVGAAQSHRTLLRDEWISRAIAAAVDIIEDGQRSGHFRDDAEPAQVAQVVVAAALGTVSTGLLANREAESKFVDSVTQMVVDHCTWR